ncbi:hypothetical protein SB749_19550, partial [Brevibacterium sp. SIMBA_078]|uniref:hypothetical protein n=1 Tax=Brevibacterium sp. SIMBA_078 TaxID=3085816 RepID=UPI003978CA6A
AMDAVEQYDHEVALIILQEVIDHKTALQTVRDEAQRIFNQLKEDHVLVSNVEQQLGVINELIKQENYQSAQEKLQQLQEKMGTNELLVT